MNATNNISSLYTYNQLEEIIKMRTDEAKEIETNLSEGLDALKIEKDSQDSPITIKGWFSWFRRKFELIDDTISQIFAEANQLKIQSSLLINNHINRLSIFKDRSPFLITNVLPIEIKLLIIEILDRTFQRDCCNLSNKLVKITKKINSY